MAVEIELPDGSKIRTDHLPGEIIAATAKKAETNWAHVLEAPYLGDGWAMIHLYRAACEHAGLSADPLPPLGRLADLFQQVESDLPDEFEGGMPDPQPPGNQVEDSPATT